MEAIKWANEEGLTLKLTRQELEELASLLAQLRYAYFVSFSSEHFEIELDE